MLSLIMNVMLWKNKSNLEKDYVKKIETLDEQIRLDESIIDSLENNISLRESLIDSLSFSHQEIIVEKVIEVDKVRELPLTESVEFLIEKLRDYEEDYNVYLMSSDSIALTW